MRYLWNLEKDSRLMTFFLYPNIQILQAAHRPIFPPNSQNRNISLNIIISANMDTVTESLIAVWFMASANVSFGLIVYGFSIIMLPDRGF